MHTTLATETLKTGETLRVECVLAPDAEREAQIRPFLGHKPPDYLGHIEAALAGACDDLETRFYIGLLADGQMVGNIMTVEANGVGILGHVNTREDQRRKGICQAIMRHQMEDFRQRGGHVLLLGTGYESPPYWIYHSFGFRDLPGGSPGTMRYSREEEPDFDAQFFAPGSYRPVKAGWKHWPLVALLSSQPSPVALRSLALRAWGISMLEGPYTGFLTRWGQDPRAHAAVLESETGAVTACATCIPDPLWRGVMLLDAFAHPNVGPEALAALLKALPLPSGTTQCYADPRDTAKIAALEQTGFQRAAILPEQFRDGNAWRDAWLYTRRADESA
ncbi:MAG TPA: GNAT family N-acetyltransferase [Chthonomonadaceae bacterium]|nr:GNAT family N-acetyltransferase [Chthonomonadaceae bacterium]